MTTPIRLMLILDDPEVRSALAVRLTAEEGCVVAAETAAGGDLAAVAAAADPDVLVWDLGDDPDPALARLSDAQRMRIPIVAMVDDERDGLRAFANGAMGILRRFNVADAAGADTIALAARTVRGGLLAIDPWVAPFTHEREGRGDAPVEALTPRERDVLALVAEGLPNKRIAERLRITEHTAKFHVHTILGKLGTQSRTEAVVRAARLGLIAI